MVIAIVITMCKLNTVDSHVLVGFVWLSVCIDCRVFSLVISTIQTHRPATGEVEHFTKAVHLDACLFFKENNKKGKQ